MSQITVFGGAGHVGSVAVQLLASSQQFSKIIIADVDKTRAEKIMEKTGSSAISFVETDADRPESLKKAMAGSSVVLNCIGPFYKYGPTILRTVLESKINYVDVCDDFDATEKLLAMDKTARDAGLSALIGMGSSPGVANVLVRFAADALLDSIDSVDIYHAHGGEPDEGGAVVKHRIHSMLIDVPVFLNGKLTTVKLFEKSGRALEEMADFPEVGTFPVYAYPHPETITLPRHIKGVQRVTNLGIVLPPAYAELIKGVVRLGITGEEPIEVNGRKVIPLEFAVAFILSRRPRLMKESGLTEAVGCLKIVVKGRKDSEPLTYHFTMSSKGRGMGEGTGIPAALGAILMQNRAIDRTGVFPPEGGVNPIDLLQTAGEFVKLGEKRGIPVMIERIDGQGHSTKMDIAELVKTF
ncbi:lysine 6-dehydrogenase [bacterium BMS3Abin05]|nr:lysine 6-dehydrogenase [bacterium BMS3Abin05]GBE27117.1 lysine 6-dehydrogenase [bacterium BMS3Bbin03]HDK36171.1 saccharopine dehydrogenase [Bacteroidota bacterium]